MSLRRMLLLFTCAAVVHAGDGRREISQALLPYAITNGGSYVVTEDLAGTNGQYGILVAADDVVLDLNGFTLSGGTGSLSGVSVPAARMNLVIRNGTLRGWGQHGLDGGSVSNGLLQDLLVSHCGQDGLRTGSGWVVERCGLASNGRDGLVMASHAVAAEVVSRNNGRNGVVAGDFCLVASADVRENAATGIVLGRYASVTRATLRDNGGHGIQTAASCVVADAVAYGSGSNAVVVGPGSRVERTQVSFAGGSGIVATNGVSIQDCTVKNSTAGGIVVGDYCFVADNSVDECLAGPGIRATGYGNRIEANSLTRNAVGIQVTGASNFVFKNTAYLNAPTNFSLNASTTGEIVINPGGGENNNGLDQPWGNYDLF